MDYSEYLLQVRAHAGDYAKPECAEAALTTLVGLACLPGREAVTLRRVLAALATSYKSTTFGLRDVADVGPFAAGALDCLLQAIIDGRCELALLRQSIGLSPQQINR